MTWDSAIPKFGIDRWAGVASDYGNPDKFKFQLDLQGWEWKGQRLTDGLPVLRTTFERSAVRLEVEQFAYPLLGPPPERRGDIAMVLLQKVRATALDGTAQTVRLSLRHERSLPDAVGVAHLGPTAIVEETSSHRVLFSAQGVDTISDVTPTNKSVTAALVLNLPATGAKEIVLKLPSPLVEADARATLAGLDYAAARSATLRFWEDYLARGAQFRVPEQVVNDLFRANLWHALRLPRRHGGNQPGVRMDLPYSNFAYDQRGTPWPVNQAIYVDYMLYDFAVTTPSRPRNSRPSTGTTRSPTATWAAMPTGACTRRRCCTRWRSTVCFGRPGDHRRLAAGDAPSRGLVPGRDRPRPAGGRAYAGADRSALERPLARARRRGPSIRRTSTPAANGWRGCSAGCSTRARRNFSRPPTRCGRRSSGASVRPRCGRRWCRCAIAPGFPTCRPTPRRRGGCWRSGIRPTSIRGRCTCRVWRPWTRGPLTTYLLHDHEDNLFLNGWGMANEPVYNQHATAYLRRDDVKPAIRAFYSMLACAFSHSVLEPVEHRWGWGQYFGPPSTDGAWFDLYRHMLIQERDDDTLLLLAATPRNWLEDGKQIEIRRAPTYFGPLSMTVESRAASGTIRANLDMPQRSRPKELLVRLRHPAGKRLAAVKVNGGDWPQFEPGKEWVRIVNPDQSRYEIVASYP